MPSHKLPHYLRTHRKRLGLSQDELATLLGCQSGAKVSRYERFERKPSLETIFAYQILFGVPAEELFRGIYDAVEEITHRRVAAFIRQQTDTKQTATAESKIGLLRAILASKADRSDEQYA